MNKKSLIFFGTALLIFVGLGLVGIKIQHNLEEVFYSKIPTEVEQIGIKSFDLFVEKDFAKVASLFVDELDKDEFYPSFVEITKQLDGLGQCKGREYIGYHINYTNGNETQKVTMQLDYGQKFIIYQYIVGKVNGNYKLIRADFDQTPISLKEQNRFGFNNKGIVHYIVFLVFIIVFLFSIVTASIAFGSNKKRRVLWSLFALCGVGAFSFVWTTGVWNFNPISIGFPVAGFSRSGSYASFLFSLRVPIGAILYWLIKHREVENRDTFTSDIELEEKELENN